MSDEKDKRKSFLQSMGVVARDYVDPEGDHLSAEEDEEQETKTANDEEEDSEDLEDFSFEDEEESASEESEISRLRNEVAELRGIASAKLEMLKESLTEKEEEEEEEFDSSQIDWSSPAIVSAFSESLDLDEDQARRFAPAIGRIASTIAKREVDARVKGLEKTVQTSEGEKALSERKQALQNNLVMGLQDAVELGGVEGRVVQDLKERGMNSLLYKELQANPVALLTPTGVLRTIQGIASDVRRKAKNKTSVQNREEEEDLVGSREQVSAGLTRRVDRTQRKTKTKEPTVEEAIIQGMLKAGPRVNKLPGVLR